MVFGWLKNWVAVSTGHAAAEPQPPAPREPGPPRPPLSGRAFYLRAAATFIVGLVILGIGAAAAWYFTRDRYGDWAVIVVAGDWRAHEGGVTEAFDNARRDLGTQFQTIGFKPENILEFSTRPEKFSDPQPLRSDAKGIGIALVDLTKRASGGCLLYFTSHGAPQGIVMGNGIFSPDAMAKMVDESCAGRPAVIVVSACFSGVFVPKLAKPNRIVITAARWDRTSFGCGQQNTYTYFDNCMLDVIPVAHTFPEVADKVKACVNAREKSTGAKPPSEPQVTIGDDAAADLPALR